MTIGWEISNDEIIFNFKCKADWCSIGFANTMFGCDMIVALQKKTANSTIELMDIWSENHDTPFSDTDLQGTNDLKYIKGGYSTSSGRMIDVYFSRKLDTGDKYDKPIVPDQVMDINWAYQKRTKRFDEHDDYGASTIVFASKTEKANYQVDENDFAYYATHALLMIISWGILAPAAIIVARHYKSWKLWYPCHLISFSLVIFFTLFSVGLAFYKHPASYETFTEVPRYHARLGFLLTGTVVSQGISGLIVRWLQTSSTSFSAIYQTRRLHKSIGWIMAILGVLINISGFWLVESELDEVSGILFWTAICTLICVSFEIDHKWINLIPSQCVVWAKLKLSKRFPFLYKASRSITHREALKEMTMKNKDYMFYEEFVIDITDFKFSHPGGAYMLNDSIGEDTGKYMIGCSSANGDLEPYTHSSESFDLLKKLVVAKVPYPDEFLIPLNYEELMDSMMWSVKSQHILSENTYLLVLSSKNFNMSSKCKNPSWLGKHFRINAEVDGKNVSRYYSAFFCNLNSWAIECQESGYRVSTYPNVKSGRLQLIYKEYPQGALTQHLKSCQAKDKINLKGPLGPGLCLSEFSGKYVAFAAGTGLVPFLDIACYLWTIRNNPQVEFSFTLIVSFRSLKDFFGLDLLEATASALGESRFKLVVITSERRELLPGLVKECGALKPDLAWVCGPSGYNKCILDSLKAEGLSRDKIIVM